MILSDLALLNDDTRVVGIMSTHGNPLMSSLPFIGNQSGQRVTDTR